MANKVKSRWTVTFDKGGANEYVLCGAGMFLADVLAVGGEQVTEDGDYIEAEDSEPLALGNVKRPQKLTVHMTHADRETALEWCFQQDLAIPVGVAAALTVAIEGGATYVYSPCAIARWNFAPRRMGLETEATYELKCGALTLGAPPPVGPGVPPINPFAGLINIVGAVAAQRDAGGGICEHLEEIASWANPAALDDLVQATAGSRPLSLAGPGLCLPGTAGNAFDLGDIGQADTGAEWRMMIEVILPSYTPATRICLASKWSAAGNQRSYAVYLETDGKLTATWSSDGTAGTIVTATSTVPVPATAGQRIALTVTRLTTLVAFSARSSGSSVNIGPAVTVPAGAAADTTAPLVLGATDGGTLNPLAGLVLNFRLWKDNSEGGVNGGLPQLATVNCEFERSGAPVIGNGAGTMTIGYSVLRSGLLPALLLRRVPAWFDGIDDSVELVVPAALNAVSGITLAWMGVPTRLTGTQDLIYCGSQTADARVLLRLNGSNVELHVRRLNADTPLVLTTAISFPNLDPRVLSAQIDYTNGVVNLYVDDVLAASGAVSTGVSSGTNSSATRLMAGAGGANPTAGLMHYAHLSEGVQTVGEHATLIAQIRAEAYY